MPNLKLAKLPDRTLVKITIAVSLELNKSLGAYADAYRETYGEAEKVNDLIPFMLERFLSSDRSFVKSKKATL